MLNQAGDPRDETRWRSWHHLNRPLVAERLQLGERSERVALGKQRQCRIVLRVAVLVGLSRVLLLNAACVWQHHLREVLRAGCAEHAASVALCNETRKVSHVVQVGVCEDDGVQALWRNGKLIPVSETQILESLKQSAVEQNLLAVVFEEVLGPCYGACRTKKCQFRHVTNDDIRLLSRSPSGVLLCPIWERELSPQPSL